MTNAELTNEDWARLYRALDALIADHRQACRECEANASDENYAYRRQALEQANFHYKELNALSLLRPRIWRLREETSNDQR